MLLDKNEKGIISGVIRRSTWVNAEILIAPNRGSDTKPNDFTTNDFGKSIKKSFREQVIELMQRGQVPEICQEKIRQIILEDEAEKLKKCPFCPGNEVVTPKPTLVVVKNNQLIVKPAEEINDWQCRAVPNAFPALRTEGISKFLVDQYKAETIILNAHGAHEVIVETPDHYATLADYSLQQIVNWLSVVIERTEDLYCDPKIRFVSVFKNYGPDAAASLAHPHTQIIGLPCIPEKIDDRMGRLYKYESNNAYSLAKITIERSSDEARVIAQNSNFISFVPYEQKFPFESWIMPKRLENRFYRSQNNLFELAEVISENFRRLKAVFGVLPNFNFYLDECPDKRYADNSSQFVSWRWRIAPRINKIGGFELQTGMYICTIHPDDAARILREVKI
ncbi:MAG: DUF4931 domain-containing protein [Candidatus Buchananbacteria bacterium]